MTRAVVAVLVLILLAATGVAGLEAALETAGDNVVVENETWEPDAGNVTQLSDSNRTGAYYDENVTVYDENGNLSEPGSDYEWFPGNGTVKALQGGNLDGDTSATITYGYQQTTQEQRNLAGMLGLLPQVIGILAPVFLFVLFLLFLS